MRGERGALRMCCSLFIPVFALIVAVVIKTFSAPDLGPPPGGVSDGSTGSEIGGALAAKLAGGLEAQPHAAVTLSERDLTVLIREYNPDPQHLTSPSARVRGGALVVDAQRSFGPFGVTIVTTLSVGLTTRPDSSSAINAQIADISLGQLSIPSWIRGLYAPSGSLGSSLDQLFAANPVLAGLRTNLDCLALVHDGVRLSVHRPGYPAEPEQCADS